MQQISISIRNCHGIGEFDHEFRFDGEYGPVHTLYAPNGSMKSSLASAFDDFKQRIQPRDKIFPGRMSDFRLHCEHGQEVRPENVLVIRPYVDDYQAQGVSTLLVDQKLRTQYEAAVSLIDEAKSNLLARLRKRTGLTSKRMTPESELKLAFGVENLLDGLDAMQREKAAPNVRLAELEYKTIFGDKSIAFLDDPASRSQIAAYIQQYDDLVSSSPLLTTKFTHTNASDLQKSFVDTGYFAANHWIVLNDNNMGRAIKTSAEFANQLQMELERVLSDPQLKGIFEALDGRMSATVELRTLREYLQANPWLIPHLLDLKALRVRAWGALLAEESPAFDELLEVHESGRNTLRDVVEKAQQQTTEWGEVIETFNRRFTVPFRLRVENQSDVILKADTPQVKFDYFEDGALAENVSPDLLLKTLSQGERRALYLLQVIFELEVAAKTGLQTLVIIDDIADSFDYKNKYAILSYLKDINQKHGFTMIVLSHNFDFHRTASSRLGVGRKNRWFAVREARKVELIEEKYNNHPIATWQRSKNNPIMYLATIPFARNLAEYTHNPRVFTTLTNALHLKRETNEMVLAEVDECFTAIFGQSVQVATFPARETKVVDLLYEEADKLGNDTGEYADLEAKVVLSWASRIKAEAHMIGRIADESLLDTIDKNQTHELLEIYRAQKCGSVEECATLDLVQLITPENIHLNAFMYEPLLDLGMTELRKLYAAVCQLT